MSDEERVWNERREQIDHAERMGAVRAVPVPFPVVPVSTLFFLLCLGFVMGALYMRFKLNGTE
jgi:hypothetical protein